VHRCGCQHGKRCWIGVGGDLALGFGALDPGFEADINFHQNTVEQGAHIVVGGGFGGRGADDETAALGAFAAQIDVDGIGIKMAQCVGQLVMSEEGAFLSPKAA
jgi:hypothetical protein